MLQQRKNTQSKMPMSWYWSCDYNSYLLKTQKLLSKLCIGGWGHRLVCCCDCLSILKHVMGVGDDVYPGVDLTFHRQRQSWSGPNDRISAVKSFLPSPPLLLHFFILSLLYLQGCSISLTSPVSLFHLSDCLLNHWPRDTLCCQGFSCWLIPCVLSAWGMCRC